MIIIRDNLPECISKIVGERIDNYEVVSRSGYCGKWCRIMFAAILSKKYSRGINGQCSPSKGFYPCYLFSEDLKEVYLAYMIASGNKSENRMRRIVKDIRSLDIFDGYEVDSSKMLLGKDPHKYRQATICYKKYDTQSFDNAILENDLLRCLEMHETHGSEVFEKYSRNL